MATTPRKDLPSTNAPNWNQRVTEELRVLMGRGGNGRALTAKDLIDSGIAKPGAGGGLVPGVPGGGDTEPDLTPPPMPTGFAVSAGLSTVFVEHDAPAYTQGHGHDRTVVYGVLQTGSTAPTFDQAVVLFQFQGTIGAYPAALGTRYRLWIKWQSQDGVQSVSPAGGTNGLDVQTGKIGNNDLGPLIVEAGNLANGSVSASKLAAQAVDATKFAAGIEPVSVSTAGTLPTVKSTSTIVWQGKLYRWDGGKYTAAVPTVDLTGTIIASQIAAGAVDATKFASGIEPVTNSAAASLPTVKSTTVITWQGKLYRWDGAKYTAEVAVVDLSGQIDAAKLADNAVTVSKIAAGAVEAGKLAAGAVTADKIAAAAVDATKFASGIEPVTNSTASTLPTVKSTTVITWQGKLYRWNGTAYSAAVPTTDITGQISSAQLADNAVTVAKIAAGAVDAGKLASNAVTADKIAASAVDATKFASGIEPVGIVSGATLPTVKTTSTIVFGGKLYRWSGTAYTAATAAADVTGQLTDAQLAAISAAKLTGQITGTQITDGAISTPKIAAGAVSASQIAAGAVTAGKIAANAVTATEIAAGAVTAGKIAANAVTANEIAANAVTTAKIAAGAVTAAEVAANAITASKLAISDTTNLIPDQDFNDPAAWTSTAAGWSIERSPADMRSQNAVRHTYVAGQVNYSSPMVSKRFAVEAGREYTFGIQSKPASATATYRYWYRVHFYDANSAPVIVGSSDYVSIFVGTVTVITDPVYAPSLQVIAPPGAVAADVRIYVDRGATSVDILFAGLFARMAARGELIVDGAITANKIAAKTITAAQIAAGTITAAELGAGSVTAGKIAAGSITATELAANSVTATQLAANAVVAGKVAANAITAGTIAANAVTTATIAAGAVTATEIAAKAITTDKLVIGNATNLLAEPTFDNGGLGWGAGTHIAIVQVTGPEGTAINAMRITPTGTDQSTSNVDWPCTGNTKTMRRVQPGVTYKFTVVWRVVSGTAGTLRVRDLELSDGLTNSWNPIINLNGTEENGTWLTATYSRTIAAGRNFAGFQLNAINSVGTVYEVASIVMQEMATGELIVDGAVTAIKIAAKTITAGQIAAGAISATELAAGAVTAGKIAAGSITATELAANSVTALQLAANAVTAGKVAANAITAGTIAANAVTTATIAAGAVTAAEIAAGAVLTSKLVVSDPSTMVPDAEYQDLSMWRGDSGGTVEFRLGETNALAGTVSKTVLRVNRVNSGSGYDGGASSMFGVTPNTDYVLRVNIYAPAQVDVKIRVETLSTADVSVSYDLDKSLPSAQWFANEITFRTNAAASRAMVKVFIHESSTASYVYVGKMRFAEAAAGSLIVDGAITATKVATGAITAGKIAANAVTANEIAANSITAAKIATGAVNADQIAANAILASKLVISDQSNMLLDTEFKDLTYWLTANAAVSTDAAAVAALNCTPVIASVAGATSNFEVYQRNGAYFCSVEPGRTYRLSIQVYIAAGWNGRFQLNVQGFASNASTGTTSGGTYSTDYRTTPAAAASTVTLTVDYTASAITSFVRFRCLAAFTSAAVAGLFIGRPRMWLKQDADLIVDGAIVASKIAAGAIAVGSAAIQDGAIVNAMIANATIDNAKIASLSAAKITAGALSVGSYINSSNYISGSQGWSINANGQAEFSGVIVRGTIYSSAGTIGGIAINGNGLNSGGFWGYAWPPAGQNGFHIGPNGILLGNANNGRYVEIQSSGNIYAPGFSIVNGNATFSGNLSGASGTFSGALSGASGTFSGVLTAQRVISMENLDYNIATVAVGVTAGDLVGPVNGEILGVTAPAADGNATYIVSFHADVGAGSAGGLQIQVDGGTQFQFPMNTGGMKSFSFTFSGNGLSRRVRLYVSNNNTSPASTVTARSISVIVSKR
ncbi:beta strand repeat-containing protein [Comamonas testosteroni]|uniref:beta strand repeat-containing protein n=1 Tax=Comamonas testosteroni TaxID=285 RepID=UPI00068288BA|nr:hypothetical protein [Comamonas testosteroni]